MRDITGFLVELLESLEVGCHKIISFEFNNPVGGGFGPPPDPFEERMYLLVQVQCGNPLQI